jgi:hypothetical protein
MSFFDTTDFGSGDPTTGYDAPSLLGTAQQIGADTSYDAPSTGSGTYPGQDAGSTDSSQSPWGGFMGTVGNILTNAANYAITKDAVRSGLTGQQQPAGAPAGNAQASVQPRGSLAGMLPLLLIGGVVVFIAVKAAK